MIVAARYLSGTETSIGAFLFSIFRFHFLHLLAAKRAPTEKAGS